MKTLDRRDRATVDAEAVRSAANLPGSVNVADGRDIGATASVEPAMLSGRVVGPTASWGGGWTRDPI